MSDKYPQVNSRKEGPEVYRIDIREAKHYTRPFKVYGDEIDCLINELKSIKEQNDE